MIRLILLAAFVTTAYAAPPRFALAGPSDDDSKPRPTSTLVRFSLQPMPAPRPALKYQLLPTVSELETGTAMQLYLKCFMEQTQFYNNKEAVEDREKWQVCPLSELPLDKVRGYGGRSLRYADQGARVTHIDFQLLSELRRDGIYTLLPDVQKLRSVAAALKVRLRAEIAEKKFDDAVNTAKTLLKMAHQLGEHPTVIGNLVGMAIAALTQTCLEEMIQQGGPNLYWALDSLPSPLVDMKTGIQGEKLMWTEEFAKMSQERPLDGDALEKVITRIEALSRDTHGFDPEKVRPYIKEKAANSAGVKAARARLVESGIKAEIVARMTPPQVVLQDEQRRFREHQEEMWKWLTQPYPRAEEKVSGMKKGEGLFMSMMISVGKTHRARARIEQRFRMIQIVEACRLYAAANKGRLPKTLDEVEFHLKNDPITEKPFAYTLEGNKATLRGTPPRGEEKNAAFNVIYEIEIRK